MKDCIDMLSVVVVLRLTVVTWFEAKLKPLSVKIMFELVGVSEQAVYYYVSAYSSIVALILISLCCINIGYHYYRIFHSKGKERQSKLNYVLYFVMCGLGLFISIQYGFVRTNRISNQPASSISIVQCSFGFYSSFAAIVLVSAVKYALMIHRVREAFKGSSFEYSNRTYWALNIPLIIIVCGPLVVLPLTASDTRFVFEYIPSDGEELVYCAATSIDGTYHFRHSFKAIVDLIATVIFVVGVVIYDFILLYMFTKNLWILQKELVEHHVMEHTKSILTISQNEHSPDFELRQRSTLGPLPSDIQVTQMVRDESCDITDLTDKDSMVETAGTITPEVSSRPLKLSTSNSRSKSISPDLSPVRTPSLRTSSVATPIRTPSMRNDGSLPEMIHPQILLPRSMTVEQIEFQSTEENNQSATRILTLHSLIKRYTILTWTMAVPSVLWLVLLTAVNNQFIQLFVIPVLVNVISMWFMFASSVPCWKRMKRMGCCYPCYGKGRRDINAHCCFMC